MIKTKKNEYVLYNHYNRDIEAQIAQGVPIERLVSSKHNTPLMEALLEGDIPHIEAYITQCDLNIKNIYSNCALGVACENPAYWRYVPQMLELGANANVAYWDTYSNKAKPILDFFLFNYSKEYPKDKEFYLNTFKTLLKHTDMSDYCERWNRHFISDLLNYFTFPLNLTTTTEEENEEVLLNLLQAYDYQGTNYRGNNAFQDMISSLFLDTPIIAQILKREDKELHPILFHKNKEGNNALGVYFDIFSENDDLQEAQKAPESLSLLFQSYLNAIYTKAEDKAKWKKFMIEKNKNNKTLADMLSQSGNQNELRAVLEKHTLSLEIKSKNTLDFQNTYQHQISPERKASFKI